MRSRGAWIGVKAHVICSVRQPQPYGGNRRHHHTLHLALDTHISMLRSAAARGGLAATRHMATDAAQGGATKPAQPASTPPSGPGFIRRATPLALLGGTGYVLYKGATDPEFRASVESYVPAAAHVFDLLPSPFPPPNFVTQTNKKDASAQMESNTNDAATLPSGYNSVPDILLRIEESNPQVAKADGAPQAKNLDQAASKTAKDQTSFDNLTPSQRAKAKMSGMKLPEPGDGPMRLPKPVKTISDDKPTESLRIEAKVHPKKEEHHIPKIVEVEEVVPISASDMPISKTGSTKGKLARILGKGDFHAENVQGPDVVDDSVYQKPNFQARERAPANSNSSASSSFWARTPKRTGETASALPSTGGADTATMEEVKALRAELQSHTKWEAVRLQEAVRSQMVEDKKTTAREIAAINQKHSEELARVREDALNNAHKVITERTKELREAADKQRDEEVGKLLKSKEEELRLSIALEAAGEQQKLASKREEAVADVKAQVEAMASQFDNLLKQAESAKEAAKRASNAFLLQQIIGSCRPIGSQLGKARDESELGRLVTESIPDSALQGGVSSIDMLQTDFSTAAKRGLSVAMVPEGKTGTLWGHLLGAIFSRLKIPVDTRIEPDSTPKTNEERIRLAQHLVNEGDLGGAVSILEALDGLSAEVMADWIRAARARIAADLAADVLLADAIIAQVSLTKGGIADPVTA